MTDAVLEPSLLARRSARTLAMISFWCGAATAAGWFFFNGVAPWQWVVATAVTAVILAVTWLHQAISMRASAWSMLVTTGVCFAANAVSTYDMAAVAAIDGSRFEAFNVFKLGALIVAFVAPYPGWVGYVIIAVCVVVPLVEYALLPDMVQRAFAVQEPWITAVSAVVGLFVLRHHLRAAAALRFVARVGVEKEAIDHLARTFLAMRDLTMTPLQSIALTSTLLNQGKLDPQQAAVYLDRALQRLRELSRVLGQYEHAIDWSTTEASFDAVKKLERQLLLVDQSRSGPT